MDKLFELSAELTLDTARFLQEAARAEQSAKELHQLLGKHTAAAASGLVSLQATASGVWQAVTRSIQGAINKTREFLSLGGSQSISIGAKSAAEGAAARPHATGLPFVPYDNYAASLHQGEAVLTKLEAARWRETSAAPQQPGLSAAELGAALQEALSGVQVVMDGSAVGMLVAPAVSEAMGQTVRARRYAG